jgi:hypothetical protein
MITKTMLGVVVVALALLSSGATAQGRPVPDVRAVPELAYEFDRAVALGIPAAALESKAREGYLKGAPPDRVHEAVRNLSQRLVEARDALAPAHNANEILEGAKALQQGVPASVLRSLRKVQRERSLEVSLGVLTELVVRKVPVQRAADAVTKMLTQRVAEGVMIAFGRGVQGDISAGLAPTLALDIRSRGVLSLPQAPLQGAALSPTLRPPPP